jgi:hypothetical protein
MAAVWICEVERPFQIIIIMLDVLIISQKLSKWEKHVGNFNHKRVFVYWNCIFYCLFNKAVRAYRVKMMWKFTNGLESIQKKMQWPNLRRYHSTYVEELRKSRATSFKKVGPGPRFEPCTSWKRKLAANRSASTLVGAVSTVKFCSRISGDDAYVRGYEKKSMEWRPTAQNDWGKPRKLSTASAPRDTATTLQQTQEIG